MTKPLEGNPFAPAAPFEVEDGHDLIAKALLAVAWEIRQASPRKLQDDALQAVTDAASAWSDELAVYIAPASEQSGDEDSAESQRDQATEIRAAIATLTKEN